MDIGRHHESVAEDVGILVKQHHWVVCGRRYFVQPHEKFGYRRFANAA